MFVNISHIFLLISVIIPQLSYTCLIMTSNYSNIFHDVIPAKKFTHNLENNPNLELDIREDEEQSRKLQEIIDLLVAAGYFRARIKGLSPFDKVVGGMTWCIESCNVDVDVDVLFQENSTIGQKIALTEKIVSTLPTMKCPHLIEPHQIQGLDFIHIFPVVQWLVKRSVESRQEKAEFVRSFAIEKFHKEFISPKSQNKFDEGVLNNIKTVEELYSPRRSHKRKNTRPTDSSIHVQLTLLEYGYKSGDSHNTPLDVQQNHQEIVSHEEDWSEEDLKNLNEHYTSLQFEFREDSAKVRGDNQILAIKEHVKLLNERCTKLDSEKSSIEVKLQKSVAKLEEIRLKQDEVDQKIEKLDKETKSENTKEIEELVLLNDNLKLQETQFKEYCKKEMTKLQNLIEETKNVKSPIRNNNNDATNNLLQELMENLKILRLQLAKKNRIVSALQRHIDDVPNRPELAQYQRRFLELYNQVSAKHRETKQYYTLYNTLEDTKMYMKKELSLLNSISDSYPEAIESNASREEFQKQFQTIVEGVKQSKEKVKRRLLDEKKKRDQLSSALHNLVELQRKYVAAVRHLCIECKKHEILMARSNHAMQNA